MKTNFYYKLKGTIIIVIVAAIAAVVLSSCNGAKRVARVFDKYPAEAVKEAAKRFPVDSLKVVVVKDSIHFDTLYTDPQYIFDTLYIAGEERIIKRECRPSPTIIKTINTDRFHYVRDRAFERTQSDSIQALQRDNNKAFGQITELKESLKGSKKYLWWFIALCAIVLGGVGLKVYQKLKPSINIQK